MAQIRIRCRQAKPNFLRVRNQQKSKLDMQMGIILPVRSSTPVSATSDKTLPSSLDLIAYAVPHQPDHSPPAKDIRANSCQAWLGNPAREIHLAMAEEKARVSTLYHMYVTAGGMRDIGKYRELSQSSASGHTPAHAHKCYASAESDIRRGG